MNLTNTEFAALIEAAGPYSVSPTVDTRPYHRTYKTEEACPLPVTFDWHVPVGVDPLFRYTVPIKELSEALNKLDLHCVVWLPRYNDTLMIELNAYLKTPQGWVLSWSEDRQ